MTKEININLFTCSCGKCSGVEFDKFKKHLFIDHQESTDGIKAKRSMLMHIDMKESYSSNYEWTLESGLKFTQFTEQSRTKDDYMRFRD